MKYIELTKGEYAIVDDEDYETLNSYKWQYTNDGYTTRRLKGQKGKIIPMHRQIMKPPKGIYVDHINHNTLDNRRTNLRLCTRAENYQNQFKQKNNTSGYKGVNWYSKYGKWQATIMSEKHLKHLGYYYKIEDAARAYNQAAKLYHGAFAALNDVPDKPLPWVVQEKRDEAIAS